MSEIIEGGFADPVFASQRVFSASMNALARPGTILPLAAEAKPPAPLTPELGALALTLCDHDSPIWLDAKLSAVPVVTEWLRFHTGAPIVSDPADAMFGFAIDVAELPRLEKFAQGIAEYPDRSTTLFIAVGALEGGEAFTLEGPGIESRAQFVSSDLPADFHVQWTDNRARFPLGVDMIFVAGGHVLGLPRTSRIVEA
jgi:alpha-D-ribose 1-methylphosphonate 5-triphosphate synthase subunit PhnH